MRIVVMTQFGITDTQRPSLLEAQIKVDLERERERKKKKNEFSVK